MVSLITAATFSQVSLAPVSSLKSILHTAAGVIFLKYKQDCIDLTSCLRPYSSSLLFYFLMPKPVNIIYKMLYYQLVLAS